MASDGLDRVVPLAKLDDFRVAKGDPDPRGWEVVGADGRRIGEVDELLVDTQAMKVRYLDVDLHRDLAAGADRHVLVPVGYARLDRDHTRVVVDQLEARDLEVIPAYDHTPVTRDFESSVREGWSARRRPDDAARGTEEGMDARPAGTGHVGTPGTTSVAGTMAGGAADDFYAHESFNDERFWAREHSTGLGGAMGGPGGGARRDVEPGPGGLGNTDPEMREPRGGREL